MLEKLLWEITQQPSRGAEFKADPERYLLAYPLDADEIDMVTRLDVRGLIARDVNPMLTMRLWSLMKGRDQMPEYLKQLHPDAT